MILSQDKFDILHMIVLWQMQHDELFKFNRKRRNKRKKKKHTVWVQAMDYEAEDHPGSGQASTQWQHAPSKRQCEMMHLIMCILLPIWYWQDNIIRKGIKGGHKQQITFILILTSPVSPYERATTNMTFACQQILSSFSK